MSKKLSIIFSVFFLFNTASPITEAANIAVSDTFVQVGKRAIPAVVYIEAKRTDEIKKTTEDYEDPFDYFNNELFRHFFGPYRRGPHDRYSYPCEVTGSGFLVSADGYILTNHHIIKDANKIAITLNDGTEHEGKLIGSDPKTDIAVIKIEAKGLPFLSFADSDRLQIGEWAIAIGNPFALQASFTVGVVSGKRQNLRITDYEDYIQTDAAINPGNSGGPLLNTSAEVIGVTSAIFTQSGGYMGIGFAISSNMAKHIMNQIIDKGSVTRGYLGIYLQPLDKEMAEAFNLDKTEGVVVTEVIKDSPAEKGDLKTGDIIIKLNDKTVDNIGNFRNTIALMSPGTKVKITILRKGSQKTLNIVLGTSPESNLTTSKSSQLGIEVSEIKNTPFNLLQRWGYSQDQEGILITNIKRNTLADKAGLRPGMLILQINQKKIKTMEDFNSALKDTENKTHILFLVRHQNITQFITIKIN